MKWHLKEIRNAIRSIAPAVLPLVPGGAKLAPILNTITTAMEDAEAIPGATGAEKKAHVLSIVAAGVATANSSGKIKLDPVEIEAIASSGIDTTIRAVKAVQAAHPAPGDTEAAPHA